MNVDVVFQTESAKLEKQIKSLEKRLGMASTTSSGSTGRDTNQQKKLKSALIQRDKQCVVLKHHSDMCQAAQIVPVADCKAGRISVDACYDVTNGILLSSSLVDWFDHHTFSIEESNDLNSGRIFHIRVAPLFADELCTVSVKDGMQITFGGPSDKWPLRKHLLNHFQKFQLAHQPCGTVDPPRPPRHQDSNSTVGHDGDLEDALDPLLRELPLKQAVTDQPKDNMMAGASTSAMWIDLWVTDVVEQMLAAGVQIV
ncbi:hypothetical protein DFJ73DRAFT_808211 [Zopfochytrium polystomum]|nr:hypothetical protein DFJ73DRAFT_808211 [Zopfochytrium polystomum]